MVESETEKKAVVAALERLGAAWSELDGRALGDVFTADATVIAFGYLRKGRDEIATRMGEAFQGPYKGSRIVGDVLEVRLLGDSAAVAVVQRGGGRRPRGRADGRGDGGDRGERHPLHLGAGQTGR